MHCQEQSICVICGDKKIVSQRLSQLLENLIGHVESQNFDPRVFSDLYLELLSSAAQIFKLEKRFHTHQGGCDLHSDPVPYKTFSAQIARLNQKSRNRGMPASHFMLEVLLDWVSKKCEGQNIDRRSKAASAALAIAS